MAIDLSGLIVERNELQTELQVVSELTHQCINENARIALDQTDYQKRYNALTERFEKAKTRLDNVTEEIRDKEVWQATIDAFLNELKDLEGVAEFQPALWYSLADYMTIYSKDDVRVTFKDGNEMKA